MCLSILLILAALGLFFVAAPVYVEDSAVAPEVEVFELTDTVYSVKETGDYRISVPAGWTIETYLGEAGEEPKLVHLDAGNEVLGEGQSYGIDIVVLRDANSPLEALRGANVIPEEEIPDDLSFDVTAEGPYTTYITDDLPSVGGALHVLVTSDEQKFIWFTLQPYSEQTDVFDPAFQDVYSDFWWILWSLEIK